MTDEELRTSIIKLTESIIFDEELEHLSIKDLRNVLLHSAASTVAEEEEEEKDAEILFRNYVL